MKFFDLLWNENQDIVQQIVNMDFIQEMYEGTLSDRQFYYYIEQDIHYLNDYAKASSYLAARSESVEQIKFCLELAHATFLEQERVHKVYTNKESFILTHQETNAYQNYKNFILYHTSSSPLPVAHTSILACPWLYFYLGKHFSQRSFTNTKYQYWFEANSTQEVGDFVEKQKEMVETIAQENLQYQETIKKVFRQALFFEYEFWSDAYLLKTL